MIWAMEPTAAWDYQTGPSASAPGATPICVPDGVTTGDRACHVRAVEGALSCGSEEKTGFPSRRELDPAAGVRRDSTRSSVDELPGEVGVADVDTGVEDRHAARRRR